MNGTLDMANNFFESTQDQALSILEELLGLSVTPKPIGYKDHKSGIISNGLLIDNTNIGFGDSTGIYPAYINETDTNRLATGDNLKKTILIKKEIDVIKNIPKANGGNFNQPSSPYNAQYPYNQVYQSEAGHVLEFDSTPGSERIHLFHKTGTFQEIDENGTMVTRVKGDNYEIIDRNGNIYIKGEANLTIDGALNLKVDNATNIEISGSTLINIYDNANINISGSCNLATRGDFNLRANNINLEADNALNIKTGADIVLESDTNIHNRSGGKINQQSIGDFNIKSGGKLNQQSDSDFNIKSGDKINSNSVSDFNIQSNSAVYVYGISAVNLRIPGTADAKKAEESDYAEQSNLLLPIDIIETSKIANFIPLVSLSRNSEIGFDEPDVGDYNGYVDQRIADNRISPADIMQPRILLDSFTPDLTNFKNKEISIDKSPINNLEISQFNAGIQLSKYFTLGDLTKGGIRIPTETILVKGVEYTPQQIVINLKILCINILDKVVELYGKDSFIISSGFRRPGDLGPGLVEGGDHNRGCAVDIIFNEGKGKTYTVAKELSQKLTGWNQMILEYNGNSVWLHLSFINSNNKGQCFTMNHHKVYGNTFPKNGFILI